MTHTADKSGEYYSLYGLKMESDITFPELPSVNTCPPEATVSVRLATPFPPISTPPLWIRQWPHSTGEPWLSCGKVDNGYLIRFRDLADFFINANGRGVVGTAVQGTSTATLRHLLLDQVFPMVLSVRGQAALHATAVVTPYGVCAFTAVAGTGKSTLAASFAQVGYPVLSDDCLVILERDGRLIAMPAYPGVRLWADTCTALSLQNCTRLPVAEYTDKQRVVWDQQETSFPAAPLPLARLYLVSRSADDSSHMAVAHPRIEPCPLRQAFIALLEQTFRLDVTDSIMLVREMQWLERVVTQVPVRRLWVPNSFAALPEVREAILNDQNQ